MTKMSLVRIGLYNKHCGAEVSYFAIPPHLALNVVDQSNLVFLCSVAPCWRSFTSLTLGSRSLLFSVAQLGDFLFIESCSLL